MKNGILILFYFITTNIVFGQSSNNDLKMISQFSSDNTDLRDILDFENIDFYKIKFTGSELKSKSYQLSVKEIWDGKILSDSIIINSKYAPFRQFQTVNDSILNIKIISKKSADNKLKMIFKFERFFVEKEFQTLNSDDYSLRNIVQESKMEIEYNKKFYFLAYILPYERSDASKSWCDVGTNGMDIENWGRKYGIKHYLIFEMIFE